MTYKVEDVYRTEGFPEHTFVEPPNFNDILVDVRSPSKPVIIEGQSGTGKTTVVRKAIERIGGEEFEYLTPRRTGDIDVIARIARGVEQGRWIVDDFHRLDAGVQQELGDVIKLAAESDDGANGLKVVVIGINRVGSGLIHLVHDVAKRCGIHRIAPASEHITHDLVQKGEALLNVCIADKAGLVAEAHGDYWLAQLLAQATCLMNGVTETAGEPGAPKELAFSLADLRSRVNDRLDHAFQEPVKEFCRGRRFRATNDPYFKLLKCLGEQDSSIADLSALANANPEVRGSINNIKASRITTLLESKPICARYFYYNSETKYFAVEDPALFYYIKHLDWERMRTTCGFQATEKDYEFDFALSFAGEHRDLARLIASQLATLDCSVFFDELFEANYLGKAWGAQFEEVFRHQARFVVCLLDKNHREKIWPTFERDCFTPRVEDEAVIPIYLDDTPFPGIPKDVVGIKYDRPGLSAVIEENDVFERIVYKLGVRLEGA